MQFEVNELNVNNHHLKIAEIYFIAHWAILEATSIMQIVEVNPILLNSQKHLNLPIILRISAL
jgi:hypothetical protein